MHHAIHTVSSPELTSVLYEFLYYDHYHRHRHHYCYYISRVVDDVKCILVTRVCVSV